MYEKSFVADKLRRWEKFLRNFRLPMWEEIPNLGLYMDQIIVLLTEYLDYLPPEIKEDKYITASTVNNYVRIKAMPEPVKKKYYRTHIAYLIMICTLKQTLNIATLQKLIPVGISEDEVRGIYNAYAERHRAMAEHFIEQVKIAATPILDENNPGDATKQTNDLIAASAISAGFARLLSEKLLALSENDDSATTKQTKEKTCKND